MKRSQRANGLLAKLAHSSKPRAAAEDTWAAGLASVFSRRGLKCHVKWFHFFLFARCTEVMFYFCISRSWFLCNCFSASSVKKKAKKSVGDVGVRLMSVHFDNNCCWFFFNLRIKNPFFSLGNPAERWLLHQTRVQGSLVRNVPLAPLVKGD